MISWKFAKKLFDGFSILRWTDFIKPSEYVQMEKSALQAVLTYIIGKEYEERSNNKELNWEYMVASNVYALLCKIATSDIKSTIGNKIKKDHLGGLEKYILEYYFCQKGKGRCRYRFEASNNANDNKDIINKEELRRYIFNSNNEAMVSIEDQICFMAHKFATYREFCYIKEFNHLSPDTIKVENSINPGVLANTIKDKTLKEIILNLADDKNELLLLYSYFEKLKPQVRWSQTCRLPQTTVLGHSMYVAMLTFFTIREMQFEDNDYKQLVVNSFYAALFHDLPESLTRDVISPVKRSLKEFNKALASYEYDEIKNHLISKINSKKWSKHFFQLMGEVGYKLDLWKDKNKVLGTLIKTLDNISAFVEAKISVELGVNSVELQKGIKYCSESLQNKTITGYNEKNNTITCTNEIRLNDFLASIPHYQEGVV